MAVGEIKAFLLPDLGEGLPDAEIVEWLVPVGGAVKLDQPLVSMETAKAVVEVPSPFSGTLLKIYGEAGSVIVTGTPLADFALNDGPQRAAGHDTGHHAAHTPAVAHAPAPVVALAAAPAQTSAPAARADAGTVVGAMQASDHVQTQGLVEIAGVKAMPAVRALAKKMGVDMASVWATGVAGSVTLDDVKRAAANPVERAAAPAVISKPFAQISPASATPPARAVANAAVINDVDTPMRGVRRNMARIMAQAHSEVVPTTLMDDADIYAWMPGNDITIRLLRALVIACQKEPALNSWLNAKEGTLRRHSKVDVGIAVDTDDGLFVPALRGAERLSAVQIRAELDRIRAQVKTRSIPAEDLTGYTISLSNFGVFAGKYATPIVVPPCVAIVAAGKLYWQAVPVMGGFEAHRYIPLSLTFDHRACTGGEAARFLRAMLDDLALPH
jgi:2-oxoisovalerate dehydrogenase E2 component (dihydrolipoyl transacylase)